VLFVGGLPQNGMYCDSLGYDVCRRNKKYKLKKIKHTKISERNNFSVE
jgi:hypothetical protein